MLCYNAGMHMTAYWLNFKKKQAGEGKYYYFYPYTRCEIDDTPTFFIDGKQYVRIEVSEEMYAALREMDDEEYNDERSAHNKRWTADVPRLANEDGDMVDFWTDRAEDKRTHDIADDICEEMDRRAAVRSLPPLERSIYHADRAGFTQCEIAKMVGVDQATVSRKLDRLYDRMNAVRLHDGTRTRRELAFEIGWESFLRNGNMKNDADLRAVIFQILVGEGFLETLHKWFCSPRELLRYSIRYLMVGGKETKEGLLEQISGTAREFYRQNFAEEPNWLQMLCLRVLRELERRVLTMPEPSGNVFHGMERAVQELAERRWMTYDFYLDEVLSRKYELRRIRRICAFAKRIAAKTRRKDVRLSMRREIARMTEERFQIQQELKDAIEMHRASLPPEVAAKLYKRTIKKTDKS